MNFRNISSWCIRNPVPPIVLFIGLTLAGLVAFMRMDVQQQPGHRIPGGQRQHHPARRGADRDGEPDHAAGRSRRSAASPASTRSTARSAKATATPSSSSRSAPTRPGGQRGARTRSTRSAATCPTASSSRRSSRRTSPATRSLFVAAETTDMTLEQLSWFVDNTCRQAAARRSRAWPQVDPRRRRRPRDPGDPRSGRDAGAGRHRRPGQHRSCARSTSTPPAAAPRSPARGSRCACSATPRNAYRAVADPDRRSPAAARSSWPTSARSATAYSASSAPSPR